MWSIASNNSPTPIPMFVEFLHPQPKFKTPADPNGHMFWEIVCGGDMFWEICVFYFHSSVFIFYTYIPSLSSNQSRHVNYLRNFHKKLVIPNISHTKHLNFVNIWSEEYHIQLYQFLPSNIFIPPPLLHFIPFPWAALLININAMENYSLSRSYFQITYSKYEELGK